LTTSEVGKDVQQLEQKSMLCSSLCLILDRVEFIARCAKNFA
jgi:hypothetical protein